jgi:hypothetical protein
VDLSKLFAGLVLFLGLFVATTAVAGNEAKAKSQAHEHFAAGLAHVDDPAGPKYEDAYREFKTAYAQYQSHEIAVNIGYCAFYLERDAEAIEMYELYLAKATARDIPKKKREQMMKDIQSLRAGLVKVSLRVTPAYATLIDERFPSKGATIVNRYPIENGVAELGIHPGNHRFTLTAEGHEAQSWDFEAEPASSHAHEFKLILAHGDESTGGKAGAHSDGTVHAAGEDAGSPRDGSASSQTRRGTSPMVYVGAIATGVFAVGAVSMGLVANSKKSDFEAANDGTQFEKANGLRSDAKTFALVSDICLGAALVSAGATVYLMFAGGSQPSERARSARERIAWKFAPAVGPQHAGLALSGKF